MDKRIIKDVRRFSWKKLGIVDPKESSDNRLVTRNMIIYLGKNEPDKRTDSLYPSECFENGKLAVYVADDRNSLDVKEDLMRYGSVKARYRSPYTNHPGKVEVRLRTSGIGETLKRIEGGIITQLEFDYNGLLAERAKEAFVQLASSQRKEHDQEAEKNEARKERKARYQRINYH